jgi:hypothetical protein
MNIIASITGKRGSGKSHFLIHTILTRYNGRIIVYDPECNPMYIANGFSILPFAKSWRNLKAGKYIITHPNAEEVFIKLYSQIRNAVIVFEDFRRYTGAKFSQPLLNLLISCKTANNDIYTVAHAWGFIPLDLHRFCDIYISLKTNDFPEEIREVSDCYKDLFALYEYVKQSPDEHAVGVVQRGKAFVPPIKKSR